MGNVFPASREASGRGGQELVCRIACTSLREAPPWALRGGAGALILDEWSVFGRRRTSETRDGTDGSCAARFTMVGLVRHLGSGCVGREQ